MLNYFLITLAAIYALSFIVNLIEARSDAKNFYTKHGLYGWRKFVIFCYFVVMYPLAFALTLGANFVNMFKRSKS